VPVVRLSLAGFVTNHPPARALEFEKYPKVHRHGLEKPFLVQLTSTSLRQLHVPVGAFHYEQVGHLTLVDKASDRAEFKRVHHRNQQPLSECPAVDFVADVWDGTVVAYEVCSLDFVPRGEEIRLDSKPAALHVRDTAVRNDHAAVSERVALAICWGSDVRLSGVVRVQCEAFLEP
jgi:hypothetical protein